MQPNGRNRTSPQRTRKFAGLCLFSAIGAASIACSSQAAPFAYVVQDEAGMVSVIDTAINEVVAQIQTGNVRSVAVASDGKRIYVGAGPTTIFTLGGNTNTVVAKIAVSTLVIDKLAVAPDGKHVYVATEFETSGPTAPNGLAVQVLDTATQTVVARITADRAGPTGGMAVSQDGKHVYVGCSGKLFDVDTDNKTIAPMVELPGGGDVTGVAITPDQKHLYVHTRFELFVVDTTSKDILKTISVPSDARGVAITPDGKRAYVVGFDAMAVVDTGRNEVVATLPFQSSGMSGIAITPDGRRAYAVGSNGHVTVVDTSTNTVVDTLTLPSLVGIAMMPAPDVQ